MDIIFIEKISQKREWQEEERHLHFKKIDSKMTY